jgi:hypothetical protein
MVKKFVNIKKKAKLKKQWEGLRSRSPQSHSYGNIAKIRAFRGQKVKFSNKIQHLCIIPDCQS